MGIQRYNNIGVVFKMTIEEDGEAVDISASTTKQIKFTMPDGTVLTKTASYLTDGTDGIVTYTAVDGDLDMVGEWTATGYVAGVGGFTGHSTDHVFRVEPAPGG